MRNPQRTIDILLNMGGKYWEKDGFKRVYFNVPILKEAVELEASFRQNGSLICCTVGGEPVENEEARRLIDCLKAVKIYYDLNTNKLVLDKRSITVYIKCNRARIAYDAYDALQYQITDALSKVVFDEVQ